MLRRENIGGFWHIQPVPASSQQPRPLSEILIQRKSHKEILLRHSCTPGSSGPPSIVPSNWSTSLRGLSFLTDRQIISRNIDGSTLATKLEKLRRRTGPSKSEVQRSKNRLIKREAEIHLWRTEQILLDKVLSPTYTIELPSITIAESPDDCHTSVGEEPTSETRQCEPLSPSQERISDERSERGPLNEDDDSGPAVPLPSSTHCDDNEILRVDWSRDANHTPLSDRSNGEVNAFDGKKSYDEGNGGSFGDIRDQVVYPRDQQHTSQSFEPCGTNSPDQPVSEVSFGTLQESPELSNCRTEDASEILRADTNPSTSSHSPKCTLLKTLDEDQPLEDRAYAEVLLEVTQLVDALEETQPNVPPHTSEAVQPDAVVYTKECPQVPTAMHYQSIARLALGERLVLIKEFWEQNRTRFDVFRARRQVYQADTRSDFPSIETDFSPSWDNQAELSLLTDAVVWLDLLLAPFRTGISAEDSSILKPRIEHAVREFEATGILTKANERPLDIVEKVTAQHFSEHLGKIQASNLTRTQLLEHINIDVSTFEDLLLSAENIRYRQDLGREFCQKDDLVDGLRRIYSTITCTVPVGLAEEDRIEEPAQPYVMTYGGVSSHPYILPGRPEVFDHDSISSTRITAKGYTGVQFSERQTPLSAEYWRNLHREMSGTIAAQKVDEVGSVKLKKNPNCMNREWDGFYNPIYESGMANYATAAALRIEGETIERLKQEFEESRPSSIEQSRPSDSRRSSSDATDSSETTIKVDVGTQDNRKRVPFCLNVNKSGGCPGQKYCGAESHSNAGKHCKWGDLCRFGPDRCAYIHDTPSGTKPVHLALPAAGATPQECDLRLNLGDVLANPKAFNACIFVNQRQGCRSGITCNFNHSLEGVMCRDYEQGLCDRGETECLLRHFEDPSVSADESIHASYTPERFRGKSSTNHRNSRRMPSISHNSSSYLDAPNDRPGYDHQSNNAQLVHASESYTQPPEPMDHHQSPQDRGLPSNTPTGPRKQYLHEDVRREPCTQASDHNSRKRKEPYDQPREESRPLIERITRDERFHEQYDSDVERHGSDYSAGDERDGLEVKGVHGPRKKRRGSRKGYSSRAKKR